MAAQFGKGLATAIKTVLKHPAVKTAIQEAIVVVVMPGVNAAGEAFAKRIRRLGDDANAQHADGRSSEVIVEEDPGMATLGEVEEAIRRVEKVQVAFLHRKSGRDARDDRRGFVPYAYKNKIDDDLTVSDLIRRRLDGYERHGLKAIVKDGSGTPAHGGTRLRAVRATYELLEPLTPE